jgi:hypothetical protein
MKLVGDEKRIPALFCEQSLSDQSAAPPFENLWHRAQTTKSERRGFSRLVVMIATAVAIAALCSLVLWSQYRSVEYVPAVVLNIEPASTMPRNQEPGKVSFAAGQKKSRPSQRFARPTKTEAAVVREAVALSSWQSPTGIFMESYGGGMVKSLPQLNQSVRELESFLQPSEVKESKQ